jgi:2,3,4,5-tetrahydropyridine-2,6-dicarboxylate N-succinyltransferase
VLEPLQASPTIIEDNCFIGARSEIVEGVIVERRRGDLDGRVHRPEHPHLRPRDRRDAAWAACRPAPSWCRAACRRRTAATQLYCAVIVKKVDAQTRAKTSINELLRTTD